jgi:ribosomal protein S18 acetylase RimI-like enzyme
MFSNIDLELIEVSASEWPGLVGEVREIEEMSFPRALRDSVRDLYKIVKSPTRIFLALKAIHTPPLLVGYLAADLLEKFAEVPGIVSDQHFGKEDTIYLESVAIRADWQGRGLARALTQECLRRASERGLVRATAHIEKGAAERIGLKAQVLECFGNWYGTGRKFEYVEFPL